MFQTKFIQKIKKKHIVCSILFFRKSFHLRNNVEKSGGTRQVTDDSKTWYKPFACWVTKATDTHSG